MMTGRRTALLAAFLLTLAAAPGPAQTPGQARRPLNVVLLIIDDVRWDSLGAAGNAVVRTPRIDDSPRRATLRAGAGDDVDLHGEPGHAADRPVHVAHGITEFGRAIAPEPFAGTYPGCSAAPATGRATSASTASAGRGRTTSTSCARTKARTG